jgi:signal transduction histidine kinase
VARAEPVNVLIVGGAGEDGDELLRRAQIARARAEEMQRRMTIVAELSLLLTESLDLSTSLDKAARYLVGAMSRGCVIEICDEGGRPVKLAIAHESSEEEARLLRDYSRRSAAQEADTLVTPIETRAGTAGAITLFGTSSAGGWDPEEREFVSDIGRRIGLFVENASLYEEARKAVQVRDQFLHIAAHELRTPLTAMMLQIQALTRAYRKKGPNAVAPETAMLKIETAERQLGRLSELIEALLDVSRIASRRLKLELSRVDLARVAQDVSARFVESAAREGGKIDVRIEAPAAGLWDRVRVEQILTNLLANAVKYGLGKPITILVRRSGAMAELAVRDQGIGIPPESLGRIFDRFERAAPAISYGGLGLGLYITHQLVAAHGGTIAVTSEVGKGTEIVVRLPIGKEPPSSGAKLLDDAEQLSDLDGFSQNT